MRIPETKIDEVRNAVNIVDVISNYVQLRKRGKNFIGLCPFHQEKTPSFTVSEEKQIFHCFGCHAGGNVFKFLMDYENISFPEAVKEIASQVGIKLEISEGYDEKEINEQEQLYEINRAAAIYFSNNLLNSENGEIAREYLRKRNIKQSAQKSFGLGYAFPSWEHLYNYFKENNYNLEKANILGLIDKRDNGSYYDKFRGRIIFPIFSPNGRVIAFGGRVLKKTDNAAKYLNSPESSVYMKRKSLYGIFHSKDEIRKLDRVLLVEGYMDVIALYQAGVKNVVASSGTSLTEEQVQLLSRYTKNIIVIYDSDSAGKKASMRSIEILLKYDFDIKIAALPESEDPDSYVSNYGKNEFIELLKKSENFLEYQTARFKENGMFEDPGTYSEAVRELVRTVSFLNDELKRSILLKNIAQKFNLREKLLETELEKHLSQNESRPQIKSHKPASNNSASAINKDGVEKEFLPIERELIKLLFEGNETVLDMVFDEIQPNDFNNNTFKYIAGIVFENYKDSVIQPSALIEKINNENVKNYILELTMGGDEISRKWEENDIFIEDETTLIEYASDLIKSYKLAKIDAEIRSNNERLLNTSDAEVIREILEANNELLKEKTLLVKPPEEEKYE